jgi:hypothetical protein
MKVTGYKIADEPSPGALANLAVNPMWPFIAIMFGGAWLSWSWFVFNGIAVGSPTKRREWLWVIGGLGVSGVLVAVFSLMISKGLIVEPHIKYVMLLLVAWKLGVTYVLYSLQGHSIEIYEYYGGELRNGIYVVVAALFVSPLVLGVMPGFFRMMMS